MLMFNRKYELKNTFFPMTKVSAYILGFAWADGHINSRKTQFSIASKDNEIELIRDFFYADDRPLYYREDGIKILQINSTKIVQELESFGFTPQKSIAGSPLIPDGFEKFFLLGLLDGDGCISVANDSVLRVYLCGNQDSMILMQGLIKDFAGVSFALRERNTKGKSFLIGDREIYSHSNLFVLDCPNTKHSIEFLSWIYSDISEIPILKRKHEKFLSFLQSYDTTKICPLCTSIFEYHSTQAYCNNCRVLLRRLRNRQQDHFNRSGKWYALSELLKPEEYNVNDWLLDNLVQDQKQIIRTANI